MSGVGHADPRTLRLTGELPDGQPIEILVESDGVNGFVTAQARVGGEWRRGQRVVRLTIHEDEEDDE